ncbi:MAG: hypothetical protein NUW37_00890 [Planctomycetes bacterium]|nr:hypothetical protein [Planctomycetota bacterium]
MDTKIFSAITILFTCLALCAKASAEEGTDDDLDDFVDSMFDSDGVLYSFDDARPYLPPEDWDIIDGSWSVRPDEAGNQVFIQGSSRSGYKTAILKDHTFISPESSVKFKSISGESNRAGGIIFGYSELTYYIVRVNPLESNVNVYAYDQPMMQRLLLHESPFGDSMDENDLLDGEWHELSIAVKSASSDESGQAQIVASIDGVSCLDFELSGYLPGGRMGLWVNYGAVTAFDDFFVCETSQE